MTEPSAPAPEAKPQGVADTLRDKSLKVAGYSFLVADSALIGSGLSTALKERSFKKGFGSPYMITAGLTGLTAGAVGANFGNPKAEKQLQLVYGDLRNYLKKHNVEIPQDHMPESLAKDRGLIQHVEAFLQTYPAQLMSTLYSAIGISFFMDGVLDKRNSLAKRAAGDIKAAEGLLKKSGNMKKSSMLLIAAGLVGLLIPEKKSVSDSPAKDTPASNPFEKAYKWAQEHPLAITGTLMTANQYYLAGAANYERKLDSSNPSYLFKFLAVACFVFGNTLLAFSSKHDGGGTKMDEKTLNELADTSARVIAAQPEAVRNALLDDVAAFLCKEPYVKIETAELRQKLQERLEQVMGKGQPKPDGWQGKVTQAPANPAQPSL
jgi:hypothetical protein